ncbi:hypothetical protein C8F04DRAFT_46273 [Mycena alexandri]|uniref:Uncharacterized protein n=1 Tax=Mycena alexandri TaxID=1745969 RepID=A0AAD6SMK5_9AGAR|nr:hypothetical protein C8F04DRAFT_46273 [Mycena alexandri]
MGRRLRSAFVRWREFALFRFLGGGGGGTTANVVLDAEGSCTLSLVSPPRWDTRACGPRVCPCLPPNWSFRIAPGVGWVRTLAVAMLARFSSIGLATAGHRSCVYQTSSAKCAPGLPRIWSLGFLGEGDEQTISYLTPRVAVPWPFCHHRPSIPGHGLLKILLRS